jgi:hypothetical protein
MVTPMLTAFMIAPFALAQSVPLPPGARLVSCDQTVQSSKRGICANRLSPADFRALAPGVSWYYNWAPEPGGTGSPPANVPIEFIPMVWGPGEGSIKALDRQLSSGRRPRAVLAINEPNLVERNVAAGITPQKAVALYRQIKQVTDRHHVPLIGPQMSIGSPPNMSVTTYDPIEDKEVTYTYMVPYLNAFLHYAKKDDIQVDGLGMHPYMASAGVEGLMNLTIKTYDKPIWVTEFSNSEPPLYDIPYKLRDLVQTVDYLERTPGIAAYSYFKERNAAHRPLGLFTDKDGELNELGRAYINMPVHDPDIYYTFPGRLQAESYTTMTACTIWPTSDDNGFLHMRTEQSGATLTYQVYVETAGSYQLRLRVTGTPTQISVQPEDGVEVSMAARPPRGKWETVETTVRLKAGPQTLRLTFDAQPFGINWLELTGGN